MKGVNDLEFLNDVKDRFRKDMKLKMGLSLKNEDDYYVGMGKAFDDAFKDYARRNGIKYAMEKRNLLKPMVGQVFNYFKSDGAFGDCFADCIEKSKEIFKNGSFGLAQKFINMSFKYLYCYDDADEYEDKFQNCHMPLDKYTVRWVRPLGDDSVNQRLGAINNAWTKIDEELYSDIQTLIAKNLEDDYTYIISFNEHSSERTCVLPKNNLQAEFIIWYREKLNELRKMIERAEADFDKLGIKWI